MECRRCHFYGHPAKYCPTVRCYSCNKQGHVAKYCMTPISPSSHTSPSDSDQLAMQTSRWSIPWNLSYYIHPRHVPITTVRSFVFAGNSVAVTVTNEATVADQWLRNHPTAAYGLDVAWRPNGNGQHNPPALLQLATRQACLIMQLLYMDYIPQILVAILGASNILLSGVRISLDAKNLFSYHNLLCSGLVDLHCLAINCFRGVKHPKNLKALVSRVLHMDLRTDEFVGRSDWARRDLTEEQICYAGQNAWICSELDTNLRYRLALMSR